MARPRVEDQHPKLMRELLGAARRHGMTAFSISDKSVDRALERHYSDELRSKLAEAHAEARQAREQLALADAPWQAALQAAEHSYANAHEEAVELEAQLMAVRAELTRRTQQLRAHLDTVRDTQAPEQHELDDLRVQLALTTEVLSLVPTELYAVQAVTSVAQVSEALRCTRYDGSALADLQGQLVTVRRLKVYDRDSGWVQATTVLAEGACVCTADGLVLAGLPVPVGGTQ